MEVKNKAWRQYVSAISAGLGMMSAGTVIGWTSPSMTLLLSEDSPIKMTYNEFAWIAAMITATSSFIPLAGAFLLDSIGRKPPLLISGVFYILSWIIIISWHSLTSLYISKFIAGLGIGISMTFTSIYIGETAESNRRGFLGVLMVLFLSAGIIFESIVGPRVSFRVLNSLSMVPPVLFLLTFAWMPETPYYLTLKNMDERASTSLMWLRGQKNLKPLEKEIESIRDYTKIEKLSFLETMRAICSKKYRQQFILTIVITFAKQFSGLVVVVTYTERIFKQINSPINPPDAVVILNIFTAFFAFVCMFIVDRVGRKKLLLLSLIGTSCCNGLIATYLFLYSNSTLNKDSAWIAILGLFGFKMFLALGLSAIPYILINEIFPINTKVWCMSLNSLYESILSFTITKMFQVFDEGVGSYLLFYIFSLSLFISSVIVGFILPETKNKTFIDIQKIFESKSKNKN